MFYLFSRKNINEVLTILRSFKDYFKNLAKLNRFSFNSLIINLFYVYNLLELYLKVVNFPKIDIASKLTTLTKIKNMDENIRIISKFFNLGFLAFSKQWRTIIKSLLLGLTNSQSFTHMGEPGLALATNNLCCRARRLSPLAAASNRSSTPKRPFSGIVGRYQQLLELLSGECT